MRHRAVLLVVLSVVLVTLSGCHMAGRPRFFRVGEEGRLYAPHAHDWNDDADVVRRRTENGPEDPQDAVFALTFNDAFLKYLPDAFGVNEAVVVFEFTEEGAGQQESVTKIIGPMTNLADEAYSTVIGPYIYGPKSMEGDALHVRVVFIEVDSDEREDSAALINFVAETAIPLADPATQAEIQIVKEIADTLVAFNKNDILLDATITLVPHDSRQWEHFARAGSGSSIPLRSGTWGVVKQEAEHPLQSWFHLTRGVTPPARRTSPAIISHVGYGLEFLGSFIGDLLVSPIVLYNRTFRDVPDGESLARLDTDRAGRLVDGDLMISLNPTDKRLVWTPPPAPEPPAPEVGPDGELLPPDGSHDDGSHDVLESYESKSWATFDIIRGGDPSTWKLRRALYPLEDEVNGLLREPPLREILAGRQPSLTEALARYQQVLDEIKADRRRTAKLVPHEPRSGYVLQTAAASTSTWSHRDGLVPSLTAHGPDGASRTVVAVARTDPGLTTFDLGTAGVTAVPGEHQLQFSYLDGDSAATELHALTVLPTWVPANIVLNPDITAPVAWPDQTALVIGGLAEYQTVVRAVTVTTAAGVAHLFDSEALERDEAAGTITLRNETGAAIPDGVLTFHLKHGLAAQTR